MPERYGYSRQIRTAIDSALGQFGPVHDIGRITPDEVLAYADQQRTYTRRARGKIVAHVVDKTGLERKQVLELGTGTGELHRLLETARKKIKITYSDIDTVRVRKHLGNNVPVRELDLDNLNLPDNSQEAIISANLLDQSEPLTPPFSEIYRVLKPGGQLVVLTDLLPDEFSIYKRYADKILLPFPGKDEDILHYYYIAMTRQQAEAFGNKQPPALKEFWFAYINLKEPWERACVRRITAQGQIPVLQRNLLMLYLGQNLGFEPTIIDSIGDFHRQAGKAVTSVGFNNVEIALSDDQYIGKPQGIQKPGTRYTYAFDRLIKSPDSTLGQKVLEHAYIGVIAATK